MVDKVVVVHWEEEDMDTDPVETEREAGETALAVVGAVTAEEVVAATAVEVALAARPQDGLVGTTAVALEKVAGTEWEKEAEEGEGPTVVEEGVEGPLQEEPVDVTATEGEATGSEMVVVAVVWGKLFHRCTCEGSSQQCKTLC